jgi:hypothetical protein
MFILKVSLIITEIGTVWVEVSLRLVYLSLSPVALTLEHRASVKRLVSLQLLNPKGPSTLLVLVLVLARLVLVLARLVLVGRLVWLLLVLVNRRPQYFSCSSGFGP